MQLKLTSTELNQPHFFKEHRKISVWINDSVSYRGIFTIPDSTHVSLADTSIFIDDIKGIKGKNTRRAAGAPAVILAPVFSGLIVEYILLIYDNSFFSYFPLPTFCGIGGTLVGTITVVLCMDNKTYLNLENSDFRIIER
ncbi:MAG: hypothetical protein IPM77_07605 [Crocinitomicaceae bacterium]|nr:hypothetical protein [Crocinitomicaceae bacterium]